MRRVRHSPFAPEWRRLRYDDREYEAAWMEVWAASFFRAGNRISRLAKRPRHPLDTALFRIVGDLEENLAEGSNKEKADIPTTDGASIK